MTEFGIVHYPTKERFHGVLWETKPHPENAAIPVPVRRIREDHDVAEACEEWLERIEKGRKVMVSDNPAFDFMWMADLFHRTIGTNPFGFSARRIGDFYAGLTGDFRNATKWKSLRRTVHDHNPVNDAMGNLEAFDRMLRGERA